MIVIFCLHLFVGKAHSLHRPRFWVWKLRKTETREVVGNLSTETQPTFQVDFYKILHPEASGTRDHKRVHSWGCGSIIEDNQTISFTSNPDN